MKGDVFENGIAGQVFKAVLLQENHPNSSLNFSRTMPISKVIRRVTVRICLIASLLALVGSRSSAATNAVSPPFDWLQFLDGSSLHGSLSAMDSTNGVQWAHPLAKKPLQLKPTNLDTITFETPERVTRPNKATCRFRFSNGDEVIGNLLGLDDKKVTFDSWIGQSLQAPRNAVRSIAFHGFAVMYEGPTGVEDWVRERSRPAWEYHDGAFITTRNGTIGRDMKLPSASSIEFDAAWRGQFVLMLPIYTDAIDHFDFNNNCYVLYMGGNAAGLQRITAGGGGITYLGSTVPIMTMARKNRAHIEFRVNKEDASFVLLFDGVVVGKWKDENGFVATGTGMVFSAQMSGPMIKISNIRVSEWDGKMEDATQTSNNEDAIYLANRDKITGTIGALRDGKLAFSTWQTALQIPMPRVRQMVFGSATNTASHSPWEVRAAFFGGGSISFNLDKWEGKEAGGKHANFGRINFEPRTVRQLEFNPSYPRTNGPSDDDTEEKGASNANNLDGLQLDNGDFLLGNMESFEPKSVLRWGRSDAIAPIEFNPTAVSEIRLYPRPLENVEPTNASKIRFFDDDQIEANITSVTPDKVLCETWFAGKMELPRSKVRAISPLPGQRNTVFEGPTGIDGWTMGKVTAVPDSGEWRYKDGSFYATKSSAIARDVNLPDRASIQFDLAWKGPLGVAVALYTASLQPVNLANKDNEPEFGGFYSLQINNTYPTQLISVKKHDATTPTLASVSIPAFNLKNNAHIEIRVDKRRSLIAMLVDNTLVNQWVDRDGFAGTGTALRFVHHGTGSIRLNHIRVTDWDGLFEEVLPQASIARNDVAKLRNGDSVGGVVNSVSQEFVSMTTVEGKKMEVPWKRVKQIEFKKSKNDGANVSTNNVAEGFFTRGGSIKFTLEKWDQDGIVAHNPNLGKVVLKPAAFERIRFGPEKGDLKGPDESIPGQ